MAVDFTDLVGDAIRGATAVGRARYEARATGAAPLQDAGLNTVPITGVPSVGVPATTGINPTWIALGAAALVIVLFLARR